MVYPQCLEGERACPPDNVGGLRDYAEYLEAISDPNHEPHRELLDWKGPFNPDAFNPLTLLPAGARLDIVSPMSGATHLIAVFLENKPGQAALVSEVLADGGINLYWLTTVNNGSFGFVKFLADKCDQAVQELKRRGLMVSLVPVLAVETDNRPGALLQVTTSLRSQNINVDNCSGFVAGERAILLVEVPDIAQARATLEGQGFRLLSQEENVKM